MIKILKGFRIIPGFERKLQPVHDQDILEIKRIAEAGQHTYMSKAMHKSN